MVLLEPYFGANHLAMAFVDSATLIVVCFPSIYFFLIKCCGDFYGHIADKLLIQSISNGWHSLKK